MKEGVVTDNLIYTGERNDAKNNVDDYTLNIYMDSVENMIFSKLFRDQKGGVYALYHCILESMFNFLEFGSSMLFNFVLVWLYKYFDISVTDESYIDETRVWRSKL